MTTHKASHIVKDGYCLACETPIDPHPSDSAERECCEKCNSMKCVACTLGTCSLNTEDCHDKNCTCHTPQDNRPEATLDRVLKKTGVIPSGRDKGATEWREEFTELWYSLGDNDIEVMDDFIQKVVASQRQRVVDAITHCQRPVENGGVCGVKIDCHLHDWRQDDMKALWQRAAKVELLREVMEVLPEQATAGSDEEQEGWDSCRQEMYENLLSVTSRHGITEEELNQIKQTS